MSNLQRYDNDGLELVIDTVTGESFATVSGYARMVGKDKSTISRRLQAVESNLVKTAELLTLGGIQGVALISEQLITEWIVKDNPELATKMLQVGVRVFNHQMAGFKVTSEATQAVPQLPPSDIRLANLKDSLEFFGIDISNPRIKQPIQDLALNTLGITKALPGVSQEYYGVAELAEQLGYSPVLVAKHRSSLGRFVKKTLSETPAVTREKRLVNGTMRPVLVYPQGDSQVEGAITTYFSHCQDL